MPTFCYLGILFASSLVLLVVGVVFSKFKPNPQLPKFLGVFSVFSVFLSLVAFVLGWYKSFGQLQENGVLDSLFGLFSLTVWTAFQSCLILLVTLFILIFIVSHQSTRGIPFEAFFLILCLALGSLLTISANGFLPFYLGVELHAVPLYILLVVLSKQKAMALKSTIRYFIFSLFSSACLLIGFSLIYYVSGLSDFTRVGAFFTVYYLREYGEFGWGEFDFFLLIGVLLILLFFVFKLALFPLYFWAPDVYSRVDLTAILVLATLSKFTFIFAIFNLINLVFFALNWWVTLIFLILAFFSIAVGSFGAYYSEKISTFVAYSGVVHVGFIAIGFSVSSYNLAFKILFAYALYYLVCTFLFFFIWGTISRSGQPIQYLSEFKGLFYLNKLQAIFFGVALFSFAGVPPLLGFFAKLLIFNLLVANQLFILAILYFIATVVAALYYLRLLSQVFFKKPAHLDLVLFQFCQPSVWYYILLFFLTFINVLIPLWLYI